MAETTEFVSTIRVKDLISAFESKSDLVRVEFTRPRAKSVGNILPKNVVVRQNEFNTLDDIEKALKKLDASLNFYEVYNKEKHVAFQEQLFNILTSIVNIEDHEENASARKKQLISKTQTFVSFLNQKLPSNANQLVNQYKYTSYSARKENVEDGTKPKQNFAIYSENTKSIDITDSSEDVFVSVKKLKENFQPKTETKTEEPPKNDRKLNATPVANGKVEESPKKEKIEDTPENVSVLKLRNLFEKRSEETSKGLGIITDEKPQQEKVLYSSNVNIPYTERNLGNVRLQRSVSGNYMNYVGLLKRVDISKSTSDLNKEFPDKTEEKNDKDASGNESDAESDDSADTVEERKSVQEIRKIYSQPHSVSDNFEFKRSKSTPNVDNKERVSIQDDLEDIKVRYSTTVTVNNTKQPVNTLIVKDETNKEGIKEDEVKYSTVISDNTNTLKKELATIAGSEQEVNYSTTASTVISSNENVATLNGPSEEKVFLATATPDDRETKNEEQVATFGHTEEEVKYLTHESDSISTKEGVATLNGTTDDETSSSTITPEETENPFKADINRNEEETVQNSIASSENVKKSSTDEAVISELPNSEADVRDGSTTIGFDGLDKELEDSLIEEEIDKIDVEPTLADQEIVVNEEELKNADNEFEKLLENSAADKTVS